MNRFALRLLGAALALAACKPETRTTATPAASPPEWAKTAVIYEINVRQFTPEGTFPALQRHLPRLRDMGVDILWLMPVQPIGKLNRKGGLGSYYSIADYTAINPEYGNEADFRAFVDEAHRLGMRVILDWVANHSAHDHPWTREHKDWYVLRADGTISNARDNEGRETDWTDVAELNYDNPGLRRAMIEEMRWWVDSMHVDGFRCDVALGVPTDFWVEAVRELESAKPDIFMLAEAESPSLHGPFDMTYGWEFHHLLNQIAQGKEPVSDLDAYFAKESKQYPPSAMRMYFTSNHDENSWQGTEFERMGENHLPAFVLASTVQGSMPLLYTGQEASNRKRLRFFEKDTIDWNGPSLESFYRTMFDLKEKEPALWNGAWGGPQKRLETEGADRVYAFTRGSDTSTVVVAVNFGDAPARVTFRGLGTPGSYTDWLSKRTENLAATGTLEIPAHGWRVLVR